MKIETGKIYCGDNLSLMKDMPAESIDLIYADPPFNTNRDFGKFNDKWKLSDIDSSLLKELARKNSALFSVINSIGLINGDSDKAYLFYMAARLLECRRVLKKTGSIYLHCDQTMSHGLKLIMDALFEKKHFINEIIWKRKGAKRTSKKFPGNHDTILVYSKGETFYFNKIYTELNDKQKQTYRLFDKKTRRKFKAVQLGGYSKKSIKNMEKNNLIYISVSGKKYKKYFMDEAKNTIDDIWIDILGFGTRTNSKERTGYPTQKPLALLKRIIRASSPEGGLVLDPFCGSGTTLLAAHRLKRKWIGIDKNPEACKAAENRIKCLY